MVALDGNAIGGLLSDIFGADLTNAIGTCSNCGTAARVAEAVVFLRGPGVVVRCRTCDFVLLVVVERDGLHCVDMRGISRMREEGAS